MLPLIISCRLLLQILLPLSFHCFFSAGVNGVKAFVPPSVGLSSGCTRSSTVRSCLLATTTTAAATIAKNTPTITVDLATLPEDLAAIRACRQTAFATSVAEETKDRPYPRLASQISFCNATSVATGAALCFVARSPSSSSNNKEVWGTLDYRPTTRTIQNVLVRPECRGQGIARRLVQAVEAYVVVASGTTTTNTLLFLDVCTDNTPAYNLYKSMGYTPDGPLHAVSAALGEATGGGLLVRMRKRRSL